MNMNKKMRQNKEKYDQFHFEHESPFFYVLNRNKTTFISLFQSAMDWKWIK